MLNLFVGFLEPTKCFKVVLNPAVTDSGKIIEIRAKKSSDKEALQDLRHIQNPQ